MGINHSKQAAKRTSANSSTPLRARRPTATSTTTTADEKHASYNGTIDDTDAISPAPPRVHELEGHSDVSRPPPPPRIRHLSELIDPATLPIDGHVRSPSGQILAPEQFLVHPGRPLSIRERQEGIREKVRAASRLGLETQTIETPSEKKSTMRKSWRRFVCCC